MTAAISKEKPWIFDNLEGFRDLSPLEVSETYNWVIYYILPHLNISPKDVKAVGSFGKKTLNQISSDIDIAISLEAIIKANPNWPQERILHNIETTLKNINLKTKMIPGFNQVSFAVPCQSLERWGFAQIDFMLSSNLEWSNFIYHSPDFTKNESKYKGVHRTLLLMAILSESTRSIISKDQDGNTIKVESKIIRLPEGIYSTRRSFMGKKGLLKKAKLLKQFDWLVTNDPQEATNLIVGNKYTPKDLNSFESIWEIMNKPNFIHKEHIDLILNKFKLGLEINKLEIPKELKH